jgi:hypothetical protein
MAIRYRVLAYRPSQAPSDPAHYYKFGELFHRYKIADAAWPFTFSFLPVDLRRPRLARFGLIAASCRRSTVRPNLLYSGIIKWRRSNLDG